MARKTTRLITTPKSRWSSLSATSCRLEMELPVYTASRVSKALPAVSIEALPVLDNVHHYQSHRPPTPSWSGSPGWQVCCTFELVTEFVSPVNNTALARLSFAGPTAAALAAN